MPFPVLVIEGIRQGLDEYSQELEVLGEILFEGLLGGDVPEGPYPAGHRALQHHRNGIALDDATIIENQGVHVFLVRVIQSLDFPKKGLGIGQLAENIIQECLVVTGVEKVLGDTPDIGEPPIDMKYFPLVADCQNPGGSRGEDALQAGLASPQSILGRPALRDVVAEHGDGFNLSGGIENGRSIHLEPAFPCIQIEFTLVRNGSPRLHFTDEIHRGLETFLANDFP